MDSTIGSIIVGLLILGIAFLAFLLSSTILFSVTALLKFKETNFRKAMKVVGTLLLILLVAGILAFGLSVLIPSAGLLSMLLILLAGILSPVILAFLLKRTLNETWTNAIVAALITLALAAAISVALYFALMIPMVVLWQLGAFNEG